MRSPGYAKVVKWISEAWAELDADMIASSFQRYSITLRNFDEYSNQLRHFMRTTELVDDVVPHDEPLADENVFDDTGDEWEWQDQAFQDSESEVDQNEE